MSGSFNEWSDMAMTENTDGNWYGTVALTPGTEVEYKFKNGTDVWEDGIEGDCVNGFGNRLLMVPTASQSLNLVGFNSCGSDAIAPPAAAAANVTFSVDMSDYAEAFTTVFLSGNFNGWDGEANPLADTDGDGIWETTIPLEAGDYDFKYQLDAWTAQEQWDAVLDPCTKAFGDNGEFINRAITVTGDETFCWKWNNCDACGAATGGTPNVTFSVDMSDYTEAFTTVFLSGNFNGWDGEANPLADADGDGIWETTIPLENGNYDYKFQLDAWTVQEQWDAAESCTMAFGDNGEFINRVITVNGDTGSCFKWNGCEACPGTPAPPADSDVTFSVDMNDYMGSFTTVFLSGNFNGWDGEANPLSDEDGNGIWETTIPLMDGNYDYKFQVDAWTDQEQWEEAQSCTMAFGDNGEFVNRVITVAGTTSSCYKWNTCDACAIGGPVDTSSVTFTVDMSLEDSIAAEGMFIAGTFTDWSDVAMTDNGDGTWSYTGRFGEGDELAYKFKNGPGGWEANEVRSCTVEGTLGDRGHTVGGTDEVLATVCFNSCAACFLDVTFVVDPSDIEAVAAEGMLIAGSFNGWTDGAMTLDEATGLWSATVSLSPGTSVEYKFKNGPDGWEGDFDGSCSIEGTGNRVLIVPETAGALGTVCFNACVGCSQVTLSVTVDMNQETVAAEGVFIAGGFNGWTDGPMIDNGNGTYSASLVVEKNSTVEYKFKNGPDGWEMDFDGDCGMGNRMTAVAEEDVTVAEVCFNSCTTCTEPMVTFTVDMSEVEVAAEGVFLSGAFNDFGDMAMMDNGDGTWSATVQVAPRTNYEYKFKNGAEFEEITGACTVGFSGNREVKVSNVDVALPTVCYTSCVGCGLVGATFTVDMSQENVNAEGVRVAGSFSEWTDVLLTDVGNGIWSATVGVMPNDTIEFKYKNGPDGWEEALMGECAAENGNRTLIVAEMDAAVAQTCFNSCEICMEEPDPDPIGMTTLNIENSCMNDDGTITIRFDLQYNCDVAPGDLSGMSEIGFHSGANGWSSVVEWDAEGAATAVNNGSDVFEVTIDPVAYYGLGSIDELENIMMVFNQGATVPDEPWASEGKTDGDGGLGACADIMLVFSELRNCSEIGGNETASTASLLASGSCLTEGGMINIVFDLADNCMDAPGSLAGLSEIGFHSGANDWSSVVEWNAEGATTGVNDGNDVFTVAVDPASYYGIELADLTNIIFVFNQGPAFPDSPWDSEGKTDGDGGLGACADFNITISELPTCAADPVESMVQDLPMTYESDAVDYMLFAFGEAVATRIDNPDPSGENTSGKVMSIEKPMGAEPWAGVALPVATTMDFSTSPMMFVSVWSPRAGVPFLLKIEDTNSDPDANGNPSVISEVFANTTTANAWEVLSFDMSTHPGFDLSHTYNQVVVFGDMNNAGVGETYYVDNIGQEIISTSTIDLVQENQFTIAPNPFNSQTLVTWENANNETFQVSLLNVTGQVVRTYQNVGGESLRIAKDELVDGMYFLNFRDEKGNMGTMKLLIK